MVFSSLVFTFFFLPAVLLLYFLARGPFSRLRNIILLAASLFFYGYGEPKFVFVMVASIAFNYLLALILSGTDNERMRKLLLLLAVCGNLGLLFVYKYLGFVTANLNHFFPSLPVLQIALPIGISFFTFQALSYVVDVYRGDTPVQRNPLYVALYISFFPQLIAGPIVRYKTIELQIAERRITRALFASGARRYMTGFAKKIILANQLSIISEAVFQLTNNGGPANVPDLWLGAVCYSLQIYYDFSGYSDMAIGLGRMFGFRFEENFRYPYISASVTEFWRRWHISLGTWFRDYVYLPLGGSRCSALLQVRNLFAVWLLTGIWHGANWTFLVWGLWYCLLLMAERFLVRPAERSYPFRLFWRIVTLISVLLGWVMFNSRDVSSGLNYIRGLAGFYETTAVFMTPFSTTLHLREYGIFILLALLLSMPVVPKIEQALSRFRATAYLKALVVPAATGVLFVWAVSFLLLGQHNPFIYYNF